MTNLCSRHVDATEAARLYPEMSFVGIDISWRMIEYARAQAQARKLTDGVEFLVMDALQPLAFPDASFDLVNMRLSSSFMKVEDWPRVLHEFLRVTHSGGIVRVTDTKEWWGTSPAHNSLSHMLRCALYRSGQSIAPEKPGVTEDLPRLLAESGCQQVQSKDYVITLTAGTVGGQSYYYNAMYGFQTLKPFLRKWDCAPNDYDAIYQQALIEMQQPEFCLTWPLLTAWGAKPA